MACFTGEYPMEVPQELDKLGLEPPEWARDRHEIEWVATNGPGPDRRRPRLWDTEEAATPAP
jgi:hypothetical protein